MTHSPDLHELATRQAQEARARELMRLAEEHVRTAEQLRTLADDLHAGTTGRLTAPHGVSAAEATPEPDEAALAHGLPSAPVADGGGTSVVEARADAAPAPGLDPVGGPEPGAKPNGAAHAANGHVADRPRPGAAPARQRDDAEPAPRRDREDAPRRGADPRADGDKAADAATEPKMAARGLDVFYGDFQAIKGASLEVRSNEILALIGPSGCGKSTFLRCLNRMNDGIETARIEGEVLLDGDDIYARDFDVVKVRLGVGMVAQAPNPFPKSIYDNIAFGPRIHGLVDDRQQLDDVVENSLRRAGLWDEVKDILGQPGTALSGGQQQRLCIARAIANEPEVILMDEPCSSLDPTSTEVIEQLMRDLKKHYTVVIVTHNMPQAERISDRVAYFHLGELVEVGPTRRIVEGAEDERTRRYVAGAIG